MLKLGNIPQCQFIKLDPEEGFYNLLPSKEIANKLELHLEDHPGYLGAVSSDKLAMHLFVNRLSVVLTYTDKRGMYLEFNSIYRDEYFTLFVQWKEVGVRTETIHESLIQGYQGILKGVILSKFLAHVLSLGSKARRTTLKALFTMTNKNDMWSLGNAYQLIQTDSVWHLYCNKKPRRLNMPPESFTKYLLT